MKDEGAEMAMEACQMYYDWANNEELAGNADKATAEVYAAKLDELINECRAFKTKTVDGVVIPISESEQTRFMKAADYADWWMHNLTTGEILQVY